LIRIQRGFSELVLVSTTERSRAVPDALEFILYLAAFACFLLAAFSVRAPWAGRINLIGLGLACWVFIHVVESLRRVS
jgi:hypothetical protein